MYQVPGRTLWLRRLGEAGNPADVTLSQETWTHDGVRVAVRNHQLPLPDLQEGEAQDISWKLERLRQQLERAVSLKRLRIRLIDSEKWTKCAFLSP